MSDVWGDNFKLTYGEYPSPRSFGYEYGMLFNNQEPCKAVCHAVNNHDKMVDLLLEHKEFNEAMHEMETIWTIKESIRLHKATCELLKELGHEI